MSRPTIILGILMFAVVTALLYVWGMKKSLDQQSDLTKNLLHACGSRVMKHLKKHDTVSTAEIAKLIDGVTVRPFWSRKRLTVQKGKDFAPEVIAFLLDQQYIEEAGHNKYRRKP